MDRFWSKVTTADANGCLLWLGTKNNKGYGTFWYGVSKQLAHRVAWILTHGTVPTGMCVLHRCDIPSCVNPDHLYLGTQHDNALDREAKQRGNHATGTKHGRYTYPDSTARGEHHGRAKLSTAQVLTICELYATGTYTQLELSTMFNVSERHIQRITKHNRRS